MLGDYAIIPSRNTWFVAQHHKYHTGLDKLLARQLGKRHFDNLTPAGRQAMYRILGAYTKGFDEKYGTTLYNSMLKNGFPRL